MDLLDRVLDKGLVIHADVIISVAGIPLIGVNLRAAIAGMETMLEYGMMRDWDEAIRAREGIYLKENEPRLSEGEKLILKVFGTHYYSSGIYTAWRAGYFYLTNKRLFLFRKEPPELLFETPLEEIRGLRTKKKKHFTKDREELYLLLKTDEMLRLHSKEIKKLKREIRKMMELPLEEKIALPKLEDEASYKFLTQGEEITHVGRMWYYAPSDGIMKNKWKPGSLYLTNRRLYWYYDFGKEIAFKIPIDELLEARVEMKNLGGLPKGGVIMVVSHKGDEVYFSGNKKLMREWEKALNKISQMETCPTCGKRAPIKELLGKGCECGWVSPKLKGEELISQVSKA